MSAAPGPGGSDHGRPPAGAADMKAKCCFMALGVGLSAPAFADAGARPANAIERITIRDGTAKSEDPSIHCNSLRIDEKRARYFLRHARPSSQFNYAHAYETGSCSASRSEEHTSELQSQSNL